MSVRRSIPFSYTAESLKQVTLRRLAPTSSSPKKSVVTVLAESPVSGTQRI